MSKLKNLFLTSVVCFFLLGKAMGQFTSECECATAMSPPFPGIDNCLKLMAYFQLTGQDVNRWCSISDNFNQCCLTCQNFRPAKACRNIAYDGNCDDKVKSGQCSQLMANNLPVSFFCQKSCGQCSSQISCDNLATSCNGGQCYDITIFSQQSVRCVCPSNKGGQYCQSRNLCSVLNPCKNNADCIPSFEPTESYTCYCKPGFYGKNCEYSFVGCVNGKDCQNYGVCMLSSSGTKQCQCVFGYTGQNCESYIGGCAIDNVCQNGGTCIPSLNNPLYACVCGAGYKGDRCEVEDKCSKVFCQNSGICRESVGGGSPYCECRTGYTGARCETKIDGCTSSPCQNNGKCFALTGMDYFCICPQFVTGKQCQIYNPCANFGCLNGGTCFINTQNQAECACKNSYTGKNCETYVETCNSCYNGGTCIRKNGADTCICPAQFVGNRCEFTPNCDRGDTQISQCQQWSIQGFCNMKFTYNNVPVPLYCPISCNLCNLQCNDALSDCSTWASQGFCETINSQNNGMCRKSCAKCFYPLMQAFSSVTSQSLPAQPTPVDQWKFDRPANSSNSTTTTTKISTITTISTKGVKKN